VSISIRQINVHRGIPVRLINVATSLLAVSLSASAQTTITQTFNDMHSSDAAVANNAKSGVNAVVEAGLPTIEKDGSAICAALQDPDPQIRQDASAILTMIVLTAPQHNSVVQLCEPALLKTATDPVDRIRNNSLFVLALNPAGPPPQAQSLFEAALKSPIARTAELGASGLLKEGGASNQQLVEDALKTASTESQKLNMLYAISGSNMASESLCDASIGLMYDDSPDVQQAAIEAAVASSGANNSRVSSALLNLSQSTSVSATTRQHATAALNRFQKN
jgi:hypothetical protein